MSFRSIDSMPLSLQNAIKKQTGMKSELDMKIDAKRKKEDRIEERRLQRECEQYLCYLGVEYIHLTKDTKKHPGLPDLIFAVNGYPIAVELKTLTGKVEAHQIEKHSKMQSIPNGWHIYTIRTEQNFRELVDSYRKKAWQGIS